MKEKIIKGSGNVFIDLGFAPEEAMVLAMRSQLMCDLELLIEKRGWSQAQAAEKLGIAQSRVSDLVRGKWDTSPRGNAAPQVYPAFVVGLSRLDLREYLLQMRCRL